VKRALSGLALGFFVASIVVFFAAESSAYKPRRHHHRHHRSWKVPPPPGKSTWCQRNPKKCYSKKNSDPKVNTRCEACMDAKGNGDGYISSWEISKFYRYCSVCK
jgi:hypothetical protein